ncbi:MAG: Fur family transcriptional regulator [Sulfurovum sp.]|nr:Fur family transcriptional regulator [Sulfurovum sp.]
MTSIVSLSYKELLATFKHILKQNKLKFTNQREIVLYTLYTNTQHFTSEDLYLLIKKEYPQLSIGIATVYRTLTLLEENDIVSSISLGVQGKKYEIANKPHHDHIICEICHTIVEFENKEIEELQDVIAKENGFKLTNHLMQLYGVCKVCQEK